MLQETECTGITAVMIHKLNKTINGTSTNELASVIQIFWDVNSVSFRKLFTVFWRIVVPTSLGSVMLLLFGCLTSKLKAQII